MRFQVAEGTEEINVGGSAYKPDADGYIDCDNGEHQQLLRQLGCRGENDPVAFVAPVVAAEPPAIPEGYVSEEAVRALVEENEDMKVAIDKLQQTLAGSSQVEDQLRNRIQELEGQLAATETATGAQESAAGGAGSSEGAEVPEKATGTASKKGK